MSKLKKVDEAFRRHKHKPDEFFKRWKHDPNDRNENCLNLGAFGVEATISSVGEIAFRVRMRVGKDDRWTKGLEYFRLDSAGNVVYGYEQAIAAGMAQRNRWRDQLSGKPTVAEEEIPKLGGENGLIERYFKARKECTDPLLPREPLEGWEKTKRLIEAVYKPLAGFSCWHVTREQIMQSHTDYVIERERITKNRPYTVIRQTFAAAHIMFKWARDKYWMRPETLMGLKADVPEEESRDRILTPREWQLIAPTLEPLNHNKRIRLENRNDISLVPRWLLATACRRSMAVDAQWQDFRTVNLGTDMEPNLVTLWCVPDEKMKMGITAIFPIVGEAKRLFDQLVAGCPKREKTDYVFSAAARSAWGANKDRTTKKVFKASGTKGWHRHDLRRTTASMLEAVGADKEACKRLLAHRARTDKSATGGYLVIGNHLGALAALAEKLIEVHDVQRDIEQGRDTAAVRKLCNQYAASPEVQDFLRELNMDPDQWIKIVPNPEHRTAEVIALRA